MAHSNFIDVTERRLPPGQQLVARDKWPVIGEREPATFDQPWQLRITGKVQKSRTFSLDELKQLPLTVLRMDIHCVTRWSRPAVEFTGVLFSELMKCTQPTTDARFVSFVARSNRNHSTSLPLDAALKQSTLIAWQANGQPLSREHGGPIRNIVPGRYFYKSVKWLQQIELLADDRLGFWEAESGYHNHADPWQEERYMAATIDRRTAARLIASRDFSRRDLRSVDASQRDLTGLVAREARLRDADFRQSVLVDADFSDANLSNAHLENADLRRARFIRTDLEGANLSGADLRETQFEDCSLVGTSFFQPHDNGEIQAAVIDASTILPQGLLDALTPDQQSFLRARLS